ncbi:MAG: PadR family transcriptional regulator [Acidimicrobiales bacterium]
MAKISRDRFGLSRFGDPGLLILISLLDGAKHGHAMIVDIERTTGLRLGPGTLYGALPKLEERGLIVTLESTDRRRPYEITPDGRSAVAENVARWDQVLQTATTRLAMP